MARRRQRSKQQRPVPAKRDHPDPRAHEVHIRHEQHVDLFRGPIPSAQQLREYRDLIPDAPERFLAAFERQIDHRQHLERTYLEGQGRRSDRAQHYALGLFILGLVGAFVLGVLGESSVAMAFLGFDLVGGAGVFITGKVTQTRERIRRARIMTGQDE